VYTVERPSFFSKKSGGKLNFPPILQIDILELPFGGDTDAIFLLNLERLKYKREKHTNHVKTMSSSWYIFFHR
jgi:hypothetical protein